MRMRRALTTTPIHSRAIVASISIEADRQTNARAHDFDYPGARVCPFHIQNKLFPLKTPLYLSERERSATNRRRTHSDNLACCLLSNYNRTRVSVMKWGARRQWSELGKLRLCSRAIPLITAQPRRRCARFGFPVSIITLDHMITPNLITETLLTALFLCVYLCIRMHNRPSALASESARAPFM